MAKLTTPYGDFLLSRRAIWGASVVRIKRECTHRFRRVAPGDYVIVEHRKQPMFRSHVAMCWGEHVATYDIDGNTVELK